jgi:hypothetical protein
MRNTIKFSEKQLREKKEVLLKKLKMTRIKMVTMNERKIMREKKLTRKTKKFLILSASITGENMLHCRHMGRSVLAISTRFLPVLRWNMMKEKCS